ncbi:hypothetical protein ElyMa_003915200 [Elysia marginata]|uniref:C-type lectin domain-containing protein n=1 Tax=Elysia marginata TaxID=1093978 RepID=A0AAV4FQ31_9GAST|nr:hypothetical protein ElyMa_003915200 [Elysia marginata]
MGTNRVYLCTFLIALVFAVSYQCPGGASNDKNVFDLLYQTSKLYGLLPTVYFLSTYTTYYTDAELPVAEDEIFWEKYSFFTDITRLVCFLLSEDDVTEHEFLHINAYRNSNQGDLVSSRGVDLVAIINGQNGTSSSSSSNSSSNYSNPLYFDYWGNHPATVQNPPACLELDIRRGVVRMTTSRCDRSINRYICEKPLSW